MHVVRILGALALAGCDGGTTTPPPPEAGVLEFDAAMLAHDGGRAPADGGGSDASSIDDAGQDAGAPVAFHPNVPVTNGGHADWDVMTWLAMNVAVTDTGGLTEVFGVFRNDDPVLTVCSLTPDVHFIDAAGEEIWWIGLTVDGRPMMTSIVASCVPPGGIGLAYGNGSGALDTTRVAELRVVWRGAGATSAVPYGDVRNEMQQIIDPYGGGIYSALSGRLRVVSGWIRNPSVMVYPMIDGLPRADLSDIILMDYGPGTSWAYTTTGIDQPFFDYYVAMDFRDPYPIHADTPEVREALLQQERRHARRDRQRDRRVDL